MGGNAVDVAGGLKLRKTCGELFCDPYQMCSHHDLRCYPCHDYCDISSNNFEAQKCEEQCQDYIHDFIKHYATDENIKDALNALENLKSFVICMILLVVIALIFISVTLLFIWKRERRIRKIKNGNQDSFFKKKLASLQYLKRTDRPTVITVSETVANRTAACTSLAATQTEPTAAAAAADTGGGGGGVASSSSSSSSSSASSGQRTNTSSAGGSSGTTAGGRSGSSNSNNKLPCEDATELAFSGYDNLALKVSPVLPGRAGAAGDREPRRLQFTP